MGNDDSVGVITVVVHVKGLTNLRVVGSSPTFVPFFFSMAAVSMPGCHVCIVKLLMFSDKLNNDDDTSAYGR